MKFKILFTKKAHKQFLALNKGKKAHYKAVGKVLGYMQENSRHPSLHTHKFNQLKSPFEGDVFESYAQNKTRDAYRIFWVYGPKKGEITVLSIIPHP